MDAYETFPYESKPINIGLTYEMIVWLYENVGKRMSHWRIRYTNNESTIFMFYNEEDLVQFILRWVND